MLILLCYHYVHILIYLLREEVHFGKVDTDSFRYLDIDLLGENLYDDIYGQLTFQHLTLT